MATRDFVRDIPQSLNQSVFIFAWSGLLNGDEGQPIELAQYADRSVQVSGAFGASGQVQIMGSLDGINYVPLNDPQGNPLTITTAKIEAVSELVRWLKPVVTGDGTTDLTVTALLKR
jgi:hypothetical protein